MSIDREKNKEKTKLDTTHTHHNDCWDYLFFDNPQFFASVSRAKQHHCVETMKNHFMPLIRTLGDGPGKFTLFAFAHFIPKKRHLVRQYSSLSRRYHAAHTHTYTLIDAGNAHTDARQHAGHHMYTDTVDGVTVYVRVINANHIEHRRHRARASLFVPSTLPSTWCAYVKWMDGHTSSELSRVAIDIDYIIQNNVHVCAFSYLQHEGRRWTNCWNNSRSQYSSPTEFHRVVHTLNDRRRFACAYKWIWVDLFVCFLLLLLFILDFRYWYRNRRKALETKCFLAFWMFLRIIKKKQYFHWVAYGIPYYR